MDHRNKKIVRNLQRIFLACKVQMAALYAVEWLNSNMLNSYNVKKRQYMSPIIIKKSAKPTYARKI